MKILIIQTAFIGDVVLSTALLEKLHQFYPQAEFHFLVKKGNETLFDNHPYLSKVWILDKSHGKWKNIFSLIKQFRKIKFDYIINLHRFFSSGWITIRSGAKKTIGFDKNPMSIFYDNKYPHDLDGLHETARNQTLIASFTDNIPVKPRLYPAQKNVDNISVWIQKSYITIAPASVWFTKQYPENKWIDFINTLPSTLIVLLVGGKSDAELCERIKNNSTNTSVSNLSGKLSFLDTCALMSKAKMNFTNDSAPMHFASAMNAPITAIYCSTIPGFGFGPLSDLSHIIEKNEPLYCRPCGLHGKKTCPQSHFKCANDINTSQLLNCL